MTTFFSPSLKLFTKKKIGNFKYVYIKNSFYVMTYWPAVTDFIYSQLIAMIVHKSLDLQKKYTVILMHPARNVEHGHERNVWVDTTSSISLSLHSPYYNSRHSSSLDEIITIASFITLSLCSPSFHHAPDHFKGNLSSMQTHQLSIACRINPLRWQHLSIPVGCTTQPWKGHTLAVLCVHYSFC